jgi:FkbM family methyltransferase
MLIPFEKCIEYNKTSFKGVIHIGAHLGEECISYRDNNIKNVVWVEGNEDLMDSLIKITELQVPPEDGIMNQIYINQVLSSENDKEVKFNITNNGQSSSILELGTHKDYYPHIIVSEVKTVKTKRFDDIVKKENLIIDLYDFINLDVQGAEFDVLKGFGDILKSESIRAVYSEVNLEELYIGASNIKELISFLKEFNFEMKLCEVTPQKWGDALFLRK